VVECCCRRDRSWSEAPKVRVAGAAPESKRRAGQGACERWRARAGQSLVVLAFVMHASVSKAALQLLACTGVAPSSYQPESGSTPDLADVTQSRLVAQPDVRCDDAGTTARRLALGVPVLVLCSVGLPIGAALALRGRRDRLAWGGDVRRMWGFLYTGFRLEAGAEAWEESVAMLRKLLLAAVTVVLAPSGPIVQSVAALLVVVEAALLRERVRSYESAALNSLETMGLCAAIVTLLSAQLPALIGPGGSPSLTGDRRDARAALTAVILGSNVAFGLVALGLAARLCIRQAGNWRQRLPSPDNGRQPRGGHAGSDLLLKGPPSTALEQHLPSVANPLRTRGRQGTGSNEDARAHPGSSRTRATRGSERGSG